MLKKVFLSCIALPVCMSLALIVAARPQVPASLTAAQIVEKNVSAKGGLQAWRAVQTMSFSGKMDAGKAEGPTAVCAGEKTATEDKDRVSVRE